MAERERSPAEWQELIRELRKLVADPTRSREDRRKAQAILEKINATRRPKPMPLLTDESLFYTDLL